VAAPPIAVTDLCPIFTSDLCIYLMQCNGEGYKDLDQCKRELDCFGMTQLLDSAANHRVTYDPSKVGACHQTFLASPCTFGSFFFTPDIYQVLSYCPGTLTPNQGDGDPCVSDGECKANLYCYKGGYNQCPGVCRAKSQSGETCAASAPCASGLTCSSGSLCVPAQKVGDPCGSDCTYSVVCSGSEPCPGNIWCDVSSHTCQPGRLEGEVCGISTAPCALNLWCNATNVGTGTCQRLSAEGGPCTGRENSCAQSLHCNGYVESGADAKLGTCAATGSTQAGGSCFGTSYCAAGLVCSDFTCAVARYLGASCNATDQICTLSRCVNGTCQDHLKVGQACVSVYDCATAECVNGFCYDSSVCRAP
jgi:hypothetical protein